MQLAPPQSSAEPPHTQKLVARHSPAHPPARLLKPLYQSLKAWETIPGISRWLLGVIKRGYTLQFRRRPPCFNCVVQSLTLPQNVQVLRQEVCNLLEKGAIEKVPPSERILQPLFRHTQKRRGTPPHSRSQTHQQSARQASVQDVNAKTDLGANLPRGLVCVRGFEGRVLSHSDSTASQTVSEVCFRGYSVPILCSPVRASFRPTHVIKVHGCSSFSPQIEWGAHPQLFGRLADFSSVPGHAYEPHRLAAYSLGVPRTMCQHAEERSNPESVHHISGSVLRLRGKESPPLARTRSGHFVFPTPFQTRQLCSVEEISEAARTHGGSVNGVSSGITTHETATAMAENSSPGDSVDIGMFEHHCIPRLHRSSEAVAQPRPLQPGSPLGLGSVPRGGHDGCIDPWLGNSVRWNASVETVVESSEPVAHKPPGAGSSLLSSKGFSAAARTATCTDSH